MCACVCILHSAYAPKYVCVCVCVKIAPMYGNRASLWTVGYLKTLFRECVDFRTISHQPWDEGGLWSTPKQGSTRLVRLSLNRAGEKGWADRQRNKKAERQKEMEKNTPEYRGTQNKTIITFSPSLFSFSLCRVVNLWMHTHAYAHTHK